MTRFVFACLAITPVICSGAAHASIKPLHPLAVLAMQASPEPFAGNWPRAGLVITLGLAFSAPTVAVLAFRKHPRATPGRSGVSQ